MIQFVFGAAAGYVFGTKAGRKRYHQIKGAYEKAVNSPVTKSAVTSARATYIAGFDATSNMEASLRYGIPASGTSAHSWTLLHVDEDGNPVPHGYTDITFDRDRLPQDTAR